MFHLVEQSLIRGAFILQFLIATVLNRYKYIPVTPSRFFRKFPSIILLTI